MTLFSLFFCVSFPAFLKSLCLLLYFLSLFSHQSWSSQGSLSLCPISPPTPCSCVSALRGNTDILLPLRYLRCSWGTRVCVITSHILKRDGIGKRSSIFTLMMSAKLSLRAVVLVLNFHSKRECVIRAKSVINIFSSEKFSILITTTVASLSSLH